MDRFPVSPIPGKPEEAAEFPAEGMAVETGLGVTPRGQRVQGKLGEGCRPKGKFRRDGAFRYLPVVGQCGGKDGRGDSAGGEQGFDPVEKGFIRAG